MDPLSGAASVIAVATLAAQLANSIRKLVGFWKEVQNAPAEINVLLDDLESLAFTLAQAESDFGECQIDPVASHVLQDCQKKVVALCDQIFINARGLDSPSLKRRKWSALKLSLDKAEIDSLQRAIERAKTTVILSRIIAIQRSTSSHFASQSKALNLISDSVTNPAFSNKNDYSIVTESNMQLVLNYESPVPPRREQSSQSHTLCRLQSSNRSKRPARKPEEISSWGFERQTPIGYMRGWSVSTRTKGENSIYSEEHASFYALYPSWLLWKLGISYGLLIQARCTDGWQYTIQPFNAVPDDALIFTFCSSGNIDAVRTLLTSGKASLRDRDSEGYSPLYFATQSLNLRMVEFLIEQGADIHALSFRARTSPVAGILESKEAQVEKKIETVALFQRYSDEFDESTIMLLIGRLLMFYRQWRNFELCPLDWEDRENASMMVLELLVQIWAPSEIQLAHLAFEVVSLSCTSRVIQWVLNKVQKTLLESSYSVIHKAIEAAFPLVDPETMRLIIRKTDNVHRVFSPFWKHEPTKRAETPTSLAMQKAGTFYAWRDMIVRIEDIETFVKAELEEDPSMLANEGWTFDKLLTLFKSEDGPVWKCRPAKGGRFSCDRCGDNEPADRIDLKWRRYLRILKETGRLELGEASDPRIFPITRTADEPGTFGPDTYRFVCAHSCRDRVCMAWSQDYEQQPPDSAEVLEDCPTSTMPGAFVT